MTVETKIIGPRTDPCGTSNEMGGDSEVCQ